MVTPGKHCRGEINSPSSALKFKSLYMWQVSFAGRRSQVIVLLTQKVSQTLVKANLRPKKFLFRPN